MPNPVMILDVDGSVGDATEYLFPGLASAITGSRSYDILVELYSERSLPEYCTW